MLISWHIWKLGSFIYRCLLRLPPSHHCNKLIRLSQEQNFHGWVYSEQLEHLWLWVSAFRIFTAICLCHFPLYEVPYNLIQCEWRAWLHWFCFPVIVWISDHMDKFIFLLVIDSVLVPCACTGVLTETNILGSFLELIDMVEDEDSWFTVSLHCNLFNPTIHNQAGVNQINLRSEGQTLRLGGLWEKIWVLNMKAWALDYPKGTWKINTHLIHCQRKSCQ